VLNTPIAEMESYDMDGGKTLGGVGINLRYVSIVLCILNTQSQKEAIHYNLIQQHFEAISLCQLYLVMMEEGGHH